MLGAKFDYPPPSGSNPYTFSLIRAYMIFNNVTFGISLQNVLYKKKLLTHLNSLFMICFFFVLSIHLQHIHTVKKNVFILIKKTFSLELCFKIISFDYRKKNVTIHFYFCKGILQDEKLLVCNLFPC